MSECEICVSEKQEANSYKSSPGSRTAELPEIVHSDVCGPMGKKSMGGCKYYVTFIDDSSRYCEVTFNQQKSVQFIAFVDYKAAAENYTGKKIKMLQSDNAKENCNKEFDAYLVKNGIKRRLSAPCNFLG